MACKCGSEFIVNKKYNMCNECNHIRLHGESTYQTIFNKKTTETHISIDYKEKCVKTHKKRINHSISKRTKEKRQEVLKKDQETYLKVFSENQDFCEECGHPLPAEFWNEEGNINCIGQYSHILSKKAYPEFRHDHRNFNRLCPSPCHDRWEFRDKENMNIYKKNQETIQILFDERNERSL